MPGSCKRQCEFKLDCENAGAKFSIDFTSTSDDCSNDDVIATFEGGGISQNLQFKKHLYLFTNHITKSLSSSCNSKGEEFAAYSVDKNRILLFVKSSGRPGYDRINLALIKTTSGKLLDFKSLGVTRNNYVAETTNSSSK
jgi:hypothetical protein